MSHSLEPVDPATDRADVELRVPADGAFVSVLRTTTAGLAARLDFTIDDVEDLRIAVGEACALALGEASEVTDLTGRFYLRPGGLTVAVSVEALPQASVDLDSFAWQVLTTLSPGAEAGVRDGTFTVTLTQPVRVLDGVAHAGPGTGT